MIVETFHLSATNTDLLVAPSRLAAIPYSGTLIIEMSAGNNDATNNFAVTVQLPNGDVPLDGVHLPVGTAGAMDANDKYTVAFPVMQGGHVLLSFTETGSTTATVRCTLMP